MPLKREINIPSVYYRIGRFMSYWLFRLGWRLEVKGAHHIPSHGPLIVASNHRSYADPPLVGCGLKRPVHFLAKQELFEFTPFGWLISQVNAHPINRSHGIGALRAAQEILDRGGVIVVFPEGKRSKTDEFLKPKGGVGMLALKSKVPVVPAYIHNSGKLIRGKKLLVTYGSPIDPHHFHSYEAMAHEVMIHIQKLRDQVISKI